MSTKDIKARAEAATVGPWEGVPYGTIDGQGRAFVSAYRGTYSVAYSFGLQKRASADIDFIAHAREDIPHLLAQLEARDKTLEEVGALPFEHEIAIGDTCARSCVVCHLDRILEGGE